MSKVLRDIVEKHGNGARSRGIYESIEAACREVLEMAAEGWYAAGRVNCADYIRALIADAPASEGDPMGKYLEMIAPVKRKAAKVVRGRIEHGCVSGRSTDVVGTAGFSAAGFSQGDAVRVVPEARYRELLAAERRAKSRGPK